MARKNLLSGLTGGELPAGNSTAPVANEAPARPAPVPHFGIGGTRGAIGAVSRSIEQLKAQAVVELDPRSIDASFISDRLEAPDGTHESLVASMRDHGQQVPILVRPHPETEGRYQVVYGHRRLRAAAELERPVRAVVKPLNDEQVVVAQGQENSERTDLSFIERALFAARLEEKGFGREIIMAALSVDKTGLSRLISVAVKIPEDLIRAIGPAPKAGRDRWVEFAARLEVPSALDRVRARLREASFSERGTDERFVWLFDAAAAPKPKRARPVVLKAADGTKLAKLSSEAGRTTLIVDDEGTAGFGTYLAATIPELYAAFKRRDEA
ncbi:MAG: plasmid partitioning protein RepB [Phyllobacteriaceae bacterium]|nr:plasmid partitioning protein RepB [Phyllobacteriaceae bacterium]